MLDSLVACGPPPYVTCVYVTVAVRVRAQVRDEMMALLSAAGIRYTPPDRHGNDTFVHDHRVPPGGTIAADGTILDANGNPVLDANGKPMKAQRQSKGKVPPGGRVGPGGIILDANGKPVLGEDGQPLRADDGYGMGGLDDPRIPPGGRVGPGGVILDANGNPVLGKDGKPLVASGGGGPQIPPGGTVRTPRHAD